MGTIKRGILGGFSGKVANVVGSSWKGIAVMKSLPLSVANPNTLAQQNQRSRMSALVLAVQAITIAEVRTMWNKWAVEMSGYNAFVKKNMEAFAGGGNFDSDKFSLSEGSYTELQVGSINPELDQSTGLLTLDLANLANYADYDQRDTYHLAVCDFNGNFIALGTPSRVLSYHAVSTSCGTPSMLSQYFLYVSILKYDGTKVTNSLKVDITVV